MQGLEGMFFSGWTVLLRTVVVGALAYVGLVVFLRVSGKRTLSKMNAFDFIVTVALGSTLATILLSKDVALAEGCVAFALLIGLQFVVTWSSVRVRWVRKLVTGQPRMLAYRGRLLQDDMRSARVTEAEVLAAVRAAGMPALSDAEAVVLETDGSLNAVRRERQPPATSLDGVAGQPGDGDGDAGAARSRQER